jgi:putative peptidoglycan lipid II flippase
VLEPPKISETTQPYATARSAAGLAILSLLSPIAGIAVEMVVARQFGTSAPVDAFRIALAVVYVGQQLFVGSFFPNVIVPLFAEYPANGNEAEAWRSSMSLANLALVPTSIVSLMLFALPGAAVSVLAPELGQPAREWAIFFVRWFGLSLIPFLYSGAAIGLLYTQRVFWTPTAAQLVYNFVLVASMLVFGGALLGPASIAVGVLLATAAFTVVQFVKVTPVIRAWRARRCRTRDAMVRVHIRKGIRLGAPLLSLPLINQGTSIIAFWSLSATPAGTIAALGYAGKLMRIASLLPDVTATVLFPKFALVARASDPKELRELAAHAIRMALFVSLPMACTLFTLRAPLIALLFRHGAFSETAANRVCVLFGLFLIGMPAGIVGFYLTKILYALEDTWWPTCGTILSMFVAAVVMPPAAGKWGAEGVAATYAGIFWLAALVQACVLHFKYAACDGHSLAVFALKVFAPAAGAGLVAVAAAQIVRATLASATMALIVELAGGAIAASISYWLAAIMAGIPEALEIVRYMQWQSAPVLRTMKAAIRG